MYVKGPRTEPGRQPQTAPATSLCPGYPRIKHKHYASFSAPPQTAWPSTGTFGSLPPTHYVSLGKSFTFPSLSFPTCKIRLLSLEHLKDPLLSRHLTVPASQSHSCNYHSFKPRLMPAQCKAGWSCRAKAPHHQPPALPKSWCFSEPDGGDGTWGRT